MHCDTLFDLSLPGAEAVGGQALLEVFVRDGKVLRSPDEDEARARLEAEVAKLPDDVRRLEEPDAFPVHLEDRLRQSVEQARADLDRSRD